MYKFSKNFASVAIDVFKNTRFKAKLTGKLLAHFLASECYGGNTSENGD